MFIKQLLIAALAFASFSISGCAAIYRAEAIEGWVVDAETGKPLDGVIIVANWELRGGLEAGIPVEQLQIFETVTDQNGRYSFPAWGPKLAKNIGILKGNSPGILLFKPGYKFGGHSNVYWQTYGTEKFFWNKKTLKLQPFKGTPAEYAKDLRSLNSSLWGIGHENGEPCGWQSFPRMLSALDTQYAEFRRVGVASGSVVSRLRANDSDLRSAGCKSIDDVVK